MTPVKTLSICLLLAFLVSQAHCGCYEDWGRCAEWSNSMTGVLWQGCNEWCRCNYREGGNCETGRSANGCSTFGRVWYPPGTTITQCVCSGTRTEREFMCNFKF